MSIDSLKSALPDYAKDLKLNLGSVLIPGTLNDQQLWGTALAAAHASRNGQVVAVVEAEAARHLDGAARDAARAAAAIMAMNNIYYRFTHLCARPDYRSMPARLRMNVIGKPGVAALDFELWSLAVSAINGCGACIEAHEHQVREKGAGKEAIQDVVRIAAVIHAVAVTLEAQAAGAEVERAAA